MALPYPHGEVFFKRDALHGGRIGNGGPVFDAQNRDVFHRTILLEYVWNEEDTQHRPAYWSDDMPTNHPRSWMEDHGYYGGHWVRSEIMFADSASGVFKRKFLLWHCENHDEYRIAYLDGTYKVMLRPVPWDGEPFIYIDIQKPVRALYFPLNYEAAESNKDLCSYLMLDFRALAQNSDGAIVISRFPAEERCGIISWTKTLVIDVVAMYTMLTVPRQLRNPRFDVFHTLNINDCAVRLRNADSLTDESHSTLGAGWGCGGIDLATLISAHQGMVLVWKPMPPPGNGGWLADLIVMLATTAISFVPMVGPLLSASFSIVYAAVSHPDEFRQDNPLGLGERERDALVQSASDARKYWADGFLESAAGRSLYQAVARVASEDEYARLMQAEVERNARLGARKTQSFAERALPPAATRASSAARALPEKKGRARKGARRSDGKTPAELAQAYVAAMEAKQANGAKPTATEAGKAPTAAVPSDTAKAAAATGDEGEMVTSEAGKDMTAPTQAVETKTLSNQTDNSRSTVEQAEVPSV